MVTDIIFSAFADEMQKIANLSNYVRQAKGGSYAKALGGLVLDPKAVKEATKRFHTLKRQNRLPASLKEAPVPLSEPKSFRRKMATLNELKKFLDQNKNKATGKFNPGFMEDAQKALDAAMKLEL